VCHFSQITSCRSSKTIESLHFSIFNWYLYDTRYLCVRLMWYSLHTKAGMWVVFCWAPCGVCSHSHRNRRSCWSMKWSHRRRDCELRRASIPADAAERSHGASCGKVCIEDFRLPHSRRLLLACLVRRGRLMLRVQGHRRESSPRFLRSHQRVFVIISSIARCYCCQGVWGCSSVIWYRYLGLNVFWIHWSGLFALSSLKISCLTMSVNVWIGA
jgi:hypothetical protein